MGDTIRVDGRSMKVTGLVAFSDYSTLYKDATGKADSTDGGAEKCGIELHCKVNK